MIPRLNFLRFVLLAMVTFASAEAYADPAPFDLAGPTLQVTVTRGDKTLPIGAVPNLAPGDKLWIKADFPQAQAAHYLLIAAFLRGATNPPPDNWFFKSEPWNKKQKEGLTVTVPQDAQQVILFLAPETGGDYNTLRGAVRGRPGSFVRASQDLNQASLDRSRLDAYLEAVHKTSATEPEKLKDVSALLGRSLSIKVDPKCLERLPEEQVQCLTDKQDQLILNDGHSMSIVEALTQGPASDLVMNATYTPQANYGYYSPYIASVMDMARIMESFHTAQYQYIPALASQKQDQMALKLNTPPSFHNPKSVLVIGLPAIEAPQPPPLHAVDPKQIFCAERRQLVLPVDGAPLVFSTGYAHEMVLRLQGKDGKTQDVPVKADAVQGGFLVDTGKINPADLGPSVEGSLHGYWGFEKYDGPTFRFENARSQKWEIAEADQKSLVVGREATLHLEAESASCVDNIKLKDASGKEIMAEWKAVKPNQLEVKLPLHDAKPGELTLLVKQTGVDQPESVPLHTFTEAGRLDSFTIHAGDASGMLKGSRLDEVASLDLKGIAFTPGKLSTSQGSDELPMTTKDAKAADALKAGDSTQAKVILKDGRTMTLTATVDQPRPSVTLLGKNVEMSSANASSNIQLANQDELPQDAKLTFSLKAQSPASFSRDVQIEVATADETFSTKLNLSSGLTLQDTTTALARLDPAKVFGPSAFGPLRFRAIDNGVTGDWQPLVTLVRLPALQDLKCPATTDQPCKLSGSNLFLVGEVASNAQFDHPVQVPDGFPGNTFPVPHPTGGQLFVKLRDDPTVVNQVTLQAQQIAAPVGQAQPSPVPGAGKPEYTRGVPNPPTALTPNTPPQQQQQTPPQTDQNSQPQ